jgi:uncharacterized protein (UPF0261 family)
VNLSRIGQHVEETSQAIWQAGEAPLNEISARIEIAQIFDLGSSGGSNIAKEKRSMIPLALDSARLSHRTVANRARLEGSSGSEEASSPSENN